MSSPNEYRQRGLQFLAMANTEANQNLQLAYAAMAQSYFRLAALAEQNTKTDLVYETPAPKPNPPRGPGRDSADHRR
jgi:hypothetical protein